ncbi:hypothetical protein HID58_080197 [Brassica napus]|uniref:Uncharacterized protein n=1 Tax=Brassica napus TaxID=3708 RepID=A0ABQ7Y4A6_BRANA|nr:hypothetical protein HID58_080197 [Brassica napus]
MEGSLMLALMLHEASFPIIGTNYETLDGTCVLMQGSISVYRLNSFRHILEESNVYELNGFDVAKSNPTYKFDETPVSIRHRAYCFCWGVADTSENPQGVLQVPEIRSAHVTCQ